MAERRLALSFPLDEFHVSDYPAIAREAEELGYRDAWSSEVNWIDCFSPLAAVAPATTTMRLGTAIANVYTRGPATLAMSAAGMAETAPGRFELGIGSGSQPIVEMWNHLRFDRPVTRVREMVQFLRQALSGERTVFHGKTFSVEGFQLARPLEHRVPIHVAALRPGMLRAAGELADGAIINWLSVEDVSRSVAVVRDAAKAAGRDPDDVEITARLFVLIDSPQEAEANDLGIRRLITSYLTVPVYKAFHQWLGRYELQPMWDAWEAGDRRGAVTAIPPHVISDLIVIGEPDERRAHVDRFLDAGISTVFLHLFSFEADPAKKRERLRQAIRDHAPR
ncbi:MAG: LLM class F420-dependent oxidoreductase [Dehalococcoidia bacterium]